MSQVVFDLYCIESTILYADSTADAANLADLSCVRTSFDRVAFDVHDFFFIDQLNNLFGASSQTVAAGCTFVFVNYRQMMWPNGYRPKGAGSHAGTKTHAAVGAKPGAVLQ